MLTKEKTRHLPSPRKWPLISTVIVKELATVVKALSNPTWYKAMQFEFEALVKKQI